MHVASFATCDASRMARNSARLIGAGGPGFPSGETAVSASGISYRTKSLVPRDNAPQKRT